MAPARNSPLVEPLINRLVRCRQETIEMVRLVDEADLNRSLNPEFSPLRWHLGHIANFEAWWVLVQAGTKPTLDPEYDRLFDPIRNPKIERAHLPSRSELLDYGDRVRAQVIDVLGDSHADHPNPLLRNGFVGELVYEHECQHQEIITFLLQMLPPERKQRPDGWTPARAGDEPAEVMVQIPGGPFVQGASASAFGYDNERPAHLVELPPYKIDRSPVTELAFAKFLESGGYRDSRLWSSAGWAWRTSNNVQAPRDWQPETASDCRVQSMFERREPLAGLPVVGVSQFEAEAYARWRGCRLPSEAEWERAAAWDLQEARARRFPWGDHPPSTDLANTDGRAWGTRAVSHHGRSAAGCDDLAGQVWEWTSSVFTPYPGFTAFPYEGYSQVWFDGEHRVLRGGSWATRGPLCRASFRNWYHPHIREIFAGFRCAADA